MKSKKLLSLLLALAMVMSMAACGAKTNEPPRPPVLRLRRVPLLWKN